MKTYKTINAELSGCVLKNYTPTDFKFENVDRTLLKGLVVSEDNNPISYAAVEVIEYNKTTKKYTYLGVVFCDEYGRYAVSLYSNSNILYKLNIYSSLNEGVIS